MTDRNALIKSLKNFLFDFKTSMIGGFSPADQQSHSIWNITTTDHDCDSVYCLWGNQDNPQYYLCKRFITKNYNFKDLICFNEIISVDDTLFYEKTLLDKDQIQDKISCADEQILCVYCMLDDTGDVDDSEIPKISSELKDFIFCGFDLADALPISALLNCGFEFEKVFLPCDLNEFGLISDYRKAKEIQQKLMDEYNDDNHAYCALFAIWRKII